MAIMQKIRIYHASLAILSILSYVTGDLGIVHSWLGYGVAAVIAFRLLWALSGNRQVGLTRFYPSFEGLNLENVFMHPAISKVFMLGIMLSLLTVVATGIAMDKGKDIGLANIDLVATAYADDEGGHERKNLYEEALEETHELFANLFLFFAVTHASYLLLFKRPLAKFMLFLNKPNKGQT